MGGYRGSILRSADPPHRQLWAPIKVGFNMRKVNMEVGLRPEDEENMEAQLKSFPLESVHLHSGVTESKRPSVDKREENNQTPLLLEMKKLSIEQSKKPYDV